MGPMQAEISGDEKPIKEVLLVGHSYLVLLYKDQTLLVYEWVSRKNARGIAFQTYGRCLASYIWDPVKGLRGIIGPNQPKVEEAVRDWAKKGFPG